MSTNSEIAKLFSNGRFEQIFEFIADDATWTVVEEFEIAGKDPIIRKCREVGQYFASVQTDFKVLDIISEANKVVVKGTAEFFRNGRSVSFISASDIYEFNEQGQVKSITSYCIPRK